MRSDINLHIHTTYSDGRKTVAEVVDELKKAGVKFFSITDHDVVLGNLEAAELSMRHGLRHCNGIELSCCFDGEAGFDHTDSCHILGFDIDTERMQIEQKRIKEERKLGLRQRSIPKIIEGIDIIHRCGGVAIWAHPFEIIRTKDQNAKKYYEKEELSEEKVVEISKSMKTYGADGFEVYYQNYDVSRIEFLEKTADRFGVCRSCGTDYHGRLFDKIYFEKEGTVPNVSVVTRLRSFQ